MLSSLFRDTCVSLKEVWPLCDKLWCHPRDGHSVRMLRVEYVSKVSIANGAVDILDFVRHL